MINRNILRLFLDISMTILFLILTFGVDLSLLFHELAGIGIAAIFIFHFVINYNMYKGLKKNIIKNKKILITFSLDILLIIGMVVIVLTGVLISRYVFNFNLGDSILLISSIHNISTYICLGIIILHIGTHIKFLKGITKNLITNISDVEVKKSILAITISSAMVVLVFSNIYFNINYKIKQKEGIVDKNKDITTFKKDEDSSKEDKNESTISGGGSDKDTQTLDEFLGNLVCNGCGRFCSLLTPACSKGVSRARQAKIQYQQENGVLSN